MNSFNSLLIREAHEKGLDLSKAIPEDPVEYGRLVLEKNQSLFFFLSDQVKEKLIDDVLKVNYNLISYYYSLSDEQIWYIIRKEPRAIIHIKADNEMLEYALERSPKSAKHLSFYKILYNSIPTILKYSAKILLNFEQIPLKVQWEVIERDPRNIKYIPYPHEEICMYVIEKDPQLILRALCPPDTIPIDDILFDHDIENIEYIKDQTERMKDIIMKERPDLAIHIRDPLDQEFCDSMLESHGVFITRINNPTEEQCIRAFPTYYKSILKMKNPDTDMIISSIDQDPNMFNSLTINDKVIWHVITKYPHIIDTCDKLIDFTPEQIDYLIHNYPDALEHASVLSDEECFKLIELHKGKHFHVIRFPTREMVKLALSFDLSIVPYISHEHMDLILETLAREPFLISEIYDPKKIMCYVSLLSNPLSIYCMKNTPDFLAISKGEELDDPEYYKALEIVNNL